MSGLVQVQSRLLSAFLAMLAAVALNLLLPTTEARAACTVPNAISNGQVADATALMDNFDAVTDCVDTKVATSGSPASGNLAVFSGSKTITNGNLSGDCTTSGTLAVTCTKSGGTAFGPLATSTDAGQLTGTVSVNRFNNGLNADGSHFLRGDGVWATPPSGGGSGTGTNWWFAPPSAASFTLANGTGTNLTLTDDPDEGLLFDGGPPLAGSKAAIGTIAVPDPSGNWTLTARMRGVMGAANWAGFGITALNSASGKMIAHVRTNNNNWEIYRQTLTAWSSEQIANFDDKLDWFRLKKNGANLEMWVSADGKAWLQWGSEPISTYLGANPDRVGIFVGYNRTSYRIVGSVTYFNLTQP